MALSIFYSASVCLRPQIELPKWVWIDHKTWVWVDQNEGELTKLSTNWPNSECELTKWVRIDQIDEYELTKIRTSWLEYELTGNLFYLPLTPMIDSFLNVDFLIIQSLLLLTSAILWWHYCWVSWSQWRKQWRTWLVHIKIRENSKFIILPWEW